MPELSEQIQNRIESSFLFTREERESLMLLCECPEFAQIVEETLRDAFASENAAAKALSSGVNLEALALSREIEAAETALERTEIHSVLV